MPQEASTTEPDLRRAFGTPDLDGEAVVEGRNVDTDSVGTIGVVPDIPLCSTRSFLLSITGRRRARLDGSVCMSVVDGALDGEL